MRELKTIYIFRHGQTDWNKQGLIQGHSDIPLNDLGLAQALELSIHFKDVDIERIYSSDLRRAVQTAESVSRGETPITYSSLLREANMGEAEGMSAEWVLDHYDDLFWSLDNYGEDDFWSYCHKGGETRLEVVSRFYTYVESIVENCFALSVHGGVLRLFILLLLEKSDAINKKEPVNIPIPNCALYKLSLDGLKLTEYQLLADSSL